ncbi:MAG: hypothetical protein ACLRXC_12610 [[Clostridium] leptum]
MAGGTEAEEQCIRNLPEAERLKREQISKDDKIAQLEAELTRRDLQAEVIASWTSGVSLPASRSWCNTGTGKHHAKP